MTVKPDFDALDYSRSFMEESSSFMNLMNVIILCDELNMIFKFILRTHPWGNNSLINSLVKIV
jgi:hypothetical protein